MSNGLVAMKTLPGCTLMGKIDVGSTDNSKYTSMTVTSMLANNVPIIIHLEFECSRYKVPHKKKINADADLATMKHFLDSVTVNNDDRFKVKLLWIENRLSLPTNYKMVKKRLDSLIIK